MKLFFVIASICVFSIFPTLCFCGERALDFDSALALILARSTHVSIEESNLAGIEARNIPARLRFFPTLTLIAKEPLTGTTNFLTVPRQVELTSQWNLFRWGADIAGINSADAEQEAQKAAIKATVIRIEDEGVRALVGKIQRRMEVQVNAEIVKIRIELLKIAQERYQRGYLALQEVEKLKVDLENSRASLYNAEIAEAEARSNLERFLEQSEVSIDWPWKKQFQQGVGTSFVDREMDLAHRPDWSAAKSRVEFESQKVSRNWRLILPSVDLQASYGNYQGFFGSVTGWTGAVSVSFPLFDYLEGISRAREQSYSLAVSESTLEQIQRNAKSEWRSSAVGFKLSLSSALARDKNLILSRKLYNDNLLRFRAGRISSNDLAVDQNRMYEAELLAIQGWSAVHIYYSQLCHSMGYQVKECLKY
jgi:outer membrane protein TolC